MIDLLSLPLYCECHNGFTYKNPKTFAEHFYSNRHRAYLYDRNLRELRIAQNHLDVTTRERNALRSRLERTRISQEIVKTQRDRLQCQVRNLTQELDQTRQQLETAHRDYQSLQEEYQTMKSLQQNFFSNMQEYMNSISRSTT